MTVRERIEAAYLVAGPEPTRRRVLNVLVSAKDWEASDVTNADLFTEVFESMRERT